MTKSSQLKGRGERERPNLVDFFRRGRHSKVDSTLGTFEANKTMRNIEYSLAVSTRHLHLSRIYTMSLWRPTLTRTRVQARVRVRVRVRFWQLRRREHRRPAEVFQEFRGEHLRQPASRANELGDARGHRQNEAASSAADLAGLRLRRRWWRTRRYAAVVGSSGRAYSGDGRSGTVVHWWPTGRKEREGGGGWSGLGRLGLEVSERRERRGG